MKRSCGSIGSGSPVLSRESRYRTNRVLSQALLDWRCLCCPLKGGFPKLIFRIILLSGHDHVLRLTWRAPGPYDVGRFGLTYFLRWGVSHGLPPCSVVPLALNLRFCISSDADAHVMGICRPEEERLSSSSEGSRIISSSIDADAFVEHLNRPGTVAEHAINFGKTTLFIARPPSDAGFISCRTDIKTHATSASRNYRGLPIKFLLITKNVSAGFRGIVTQWMLKVKAAVYVDSVSRSVRERLWEKHKTTWV